MSDPETDKTSHIGTIAREFEHVRKATISLLTLISIIAFVAIFFKEINSTALVVEPVSVPEALEGKGLSSKVLASRIASHMAYMDRDASTVMPRQFSVDHGNRPDIQIAGESTSFRTIVRFLKDAFGKKDVAIIADVIENGNRTYVARVRVDGGDYSGQQYTVQLGKDLDSYSDRIAEGAMHAAMPYVLAIYLAGDEEKKKKNPSYSKSLEIFNELLSNNNKKDDNWALLAKGNTFDKLGKKQDAIECNEKLLEVDPNNAHAYYNWGKVLADLSKPEEAVEKYRKAVALDPKQAAAYNGWGNALLALKKPEEAIEKYRKAVALDPKQAAAYNGWGNALLLEKPEEAIEKYRKAVAFDQGHVRAYHGWGIALLDLKKPEEAIEKFCKAVILDPHDTDFHEALAIALKELSQKRPKINPRKYCTVL